MTTTRLLRVLLLCPLFLLMLQPVWAQNKTITGTVTDDKGQPVQGASVLVRGTKLGTATDANGAFTISIPSTANTLVVSYVGYAQKEVSIGSSSTLSVSLAPEASSLNDVVVVGYGTARRRDLTGSVVSVAAKDFNKGVFTAPDQLIQGKAAGVMVINNSGQPGGATTVRIRGTSSIRSSNNPLFVVDGVPLSGGSARPGTTGSGSFGSNAGNPLNFINPNDIASIEVLKDASATAIYGSRGANGVIIITTKRGQTGAPALDVVASSGVSNVLKALQVLDAGEYRQALKDYGQTGGDYGGSSDAWKDITRTALTQNYNLAMSGGTENGRYRISAGYLDQQGVIRTSELKKLTASLTSSFKFLPSKKLGLDINVLVTQTNEDVAPVSDYVGFEGNVVSQALQWNPTLPTKIGDSIVYLGGTTINPLASLAYYKDRANVNTVIASVSPSYNITKSLQYKFLYSVNRQVGVRKGMANRLLNLAGVQDVGAAFIGTNEETNQQITNTLNFNKQVGSDLNVNAVVGHEWLTYENRWNNENATGFPNIGLDYFNMLQYPPAANRSIQSYANPTTELQSFFARAILNLRDKYVLTATYRADGSTRFGENNKYGHFPSFGLAWNIWREQFLSNSNLFSNLKLRASWGKTGNQEFPSGASLNRFGISTQSISRSNFGNPDLKWETSTTTDVGIDFAVLRNRISGSVDYFYKKTTDVLFERTLAQPAPNGKIWVNLPGNIVNKGLEIALSGAVVQQNNLNWNVNVNATFLRNVVEGLTGFYETGALRGQGFSNVLGQRVVAGQPINVWYLGVFEGIDKATGQSIYTGGDPSANKFYVGSPNPKFLLGISTDLTYKKFTATVNLNGAFGQYLFNNTAATVLGIGNLGSRNIASSIYPGSGGVKEAISNAPAPSTRYLEKGNYLKMTNASLSYRIGDIGTAIRNLNISVTGQNLLVLTKYTGFDPEVNTEASNAGIPSLGVDYIPYPSARTILLGVNFSL